MANRPFVPMIEAGDVAPPVDAPAAPAEPLDAASRIAASAEALAARLAQSEEQQAAAMARIAEDAVSRALAGLNLGEPSTPSMREQPAVRLRDRFDDLGYTRADFEFAMMFFQGARRLSYNPRQLAPPADLVRAWRHHVFETDGGAPFILEDENKAPTRRLDPSPWAEGADWSRAMDTAETGFGLELIGAEYSNQLWAAARNTDGIVDRIRSIPMAHPTVVVPIDGDLPEMLFVGESTTAGATAYATSKTGSNKATLVAKKFTIQEIWSGELDEDSIVTFTPFLRERLGMATGLYVGSTMYNGDNTNAGTGNINSDDADPADTKHYLAYDGIRHYWLVDAAGQGFDMAGQLDLRQIDRARGRLNGGDDDVDNLIKNINWGTNAASLIAVPDWDTYMNMLNFDEVRTVDRYGAQATILNGELGRVSGIPIVSPSYASKTEADGKASTTEANNTKGQLTVFNPSGFLRGVRRETQLFFDRIQRTDQFLFELYLRGGFTRFGGNVAAGVYNITV